MKIEIFYTIYDFVFWSCMFLFSIVFIIYPPIAKIYVYKPILERYKKTFEFNREGITDITTMDDIKKNHFYIPTLVALAVGRALLICMASFW